MRLLELRMSASQCRIILLKRGYFPLYKRNLAAKVCNWCVACIYHPIEVVKVFSDCFHRHWLRVNR